VLNTILTGIAGVCIACISYLLRKAKVNREMADILTGVLERYIIERAIYAVEAWAEKKFKETGEKIASSEKMKKAMEEVEKIQDQLAGWGISVGLYLDKKALQKKIQAVFDEIEDKVNGEN